MKVRVFKPCRRLLVRLVTALLCLVIPALLLKAGIYGSFLFTFSIPLFFQIAVSAEGLSSLGIRRENLKKSLFLGLLSAALLSAGGISVLALAGLLNYSLEGRVFNLHIGGAELSFFQEAGYRLFSQSNTFWGIVRYLVFLIFVIGLGEELLWRGFIQKKLLNRISMHQRIWLTALIFGLFHSYFFLLLSPAHSVLFITIVFLAGAVWGYLYEYSKNIWSVAFSHGITAFFIWKAFFEG